MFNGVTEQLGHMADTYKREPLGHASYTPISNELWQAQRVALNRAAPTIVKALPGEIQDTSVDGPTWDNFTAIADGLHFLMESLPINSVQGKPAETSLTVLPTLPIPQTSEDLLGLMSFLSCTVVETTHIGASDQIDSAYREFAGAGAALMLFYAQSVQDQPNMTEILGRYVPEIQLAQMILSQEKGEALDQQTNLVFQRMQKVANDKIDREEGSY